MRNWQRRLLNLPRFGPRAVTLLGFGLLISASVFSMIQVRTTFQVTSETEWVSGVSASRGSTSVPVVWPLAQAMICAGPVDPLAPVARTGCFDTPVTLPVFSGQIEIRSQFDFAVERIANGPLKITLKPPETRAEENFQVVATSSADGGWSEVELPSPVRIRIDSVADLARAGQPISLPILAERVAFGREAQESTSAPQAMLRQGEISIFGWHLLSSLLGRERIYLARTVALRFGDEVSASADGAEPSEGKAGAVSVLLRADERPALQGVFLAQSQQILIRALFTEDRSEALTFLDKVLNDPLSTATWSIAGLMLGWILGLLSLPGSAPPER